MSALDLPAENRELSPYTGWGREHWAAIADHMLLSLRPYFSTTRSHVNLPGPTSSSGADSDGFEGYARSFMLFAFRLHGERGDDPHGFLDWYRAGLLAGTDPDGPEPWPAPGEVGQAKVEAASIALGLQLTRPWLWDTLAPAEKQHVIDWLAQSPHGWYPDNNWLWFRITVETFLASVGGPHDPDRVMHDLATIESYYRADGWYADGSVRAYDYYCGWAMHLYPLIWVLSNGSDAFGSRALDPVFRSRLTEFLDDYVHFIGADGMPVLQGRSLVYRFATAAPLWVGAITGATRLKPGTIRRAASGVLRAFVERGALNENGLLTLGLFGEWPQMAQTYSGSGSPYWASKGMLGLLLPADHEVWRAVEEPLPIEVGDTRRVVRAAGWLISGTRDDGIVRLYNHGADHAVAGDRAGDSPIYARFGYSSASIPPLIGDTIDSPVDNSAGVLDAGRLTHRTGFDRGIVGDDGTAAYATSVTHAHWVDSSGDDDGHDHGSGREGIVVDAPDLRTASIVRGAWEVRAVRLSDAAPSVSRVRVSGWPVPSAAAGTSIDISTDADADAGSTVVTVEAEGLVCELIALSEGGHPSVHEESGTSPIGAVTTVPWMEFELAPGETAIVASRLARSASAAHARPRARAVGTSRSAVLRVTWDDGTSTVTF
ncbi:DUF2264 domain-containing protein [Humibacter albus]|uniref:DUF2264 domain-containing protein n=1 Tax=Humibacter albus TaxID=427754 RepID=UPI0003B79910|nr:DUF2264 domain-containing protein [Humibacter albus]